MLLIFKPPQPVGTFLLRLIFTGNVDDVFLLIKRIDFMGHKVGNVFFIEFDGADGAVFLLNTEKGFFHAEGGDSASEAPDLAGLLAPLYVVLEGFSDGGGVFVEDGCLCRCLCRGTARTPEFHQYHQPGGRGRPCSSGCT